MKSNVIKWVGVAALIYIGYKVFKNFSASVAAGETAVNTVLDN